MQSFASFAKNVLWWHYVKVISLEFLIQFDQWASVPRKKYWTETGRWNITWRLVPCINTRSGAFYRYLAEEHVQGLGTWWKHMVPRYTIGPRVYHGWQLSAKSSTLLLCLYVPVLQTISDCHGTSWLACRHSLLPRSVFLKLQPPGLFPCHCLQVRLGEAFCLSRHSTLCEGPIVQKKCSKWEKDE